MGFKISNNSIKINVKSFDNLNNFNRNIDLKTYDNIQEVDYAQYDTAVQKTNFNFAAEDVVFSNEGSYSLIDLADDLLEFGNTVYDIYKATDATLTNISMSLTEGLVSFVESIVDCAVMLDALNSTLYTSLWDLGAGIFTGDWDFSTTKSLWTKYVMPVVAFNATDWVFDKAYSTDYFKKVDENAVGWAKRSNENGEKGVLYSIGEGVGYYVGLIVLTYFTAGIGTAATTGATTVSTFANAAAQGVVGAASSFGKNSQKNFNNAYQIAAEEDREVNLKDAAKATGQAATNAAIDGSIYFAAGAIKADLSGQTSKVVSDWLAPTGVKMVKAHYNEMADSIWTGSGYNIKDVAIDAGSIFLAETAAAGFNGVFKVENFKAPIKPDVNIDITADINVPDQDLNEVKNGIDEILRNALKKGYEKGIEKGVKEVTSTTYDGIIDFVDS